MSRFSPSGVTQDRSGEIIGAAISQALAGIGQRRQMHRLEAKQDTATQRQNAIQDAQLGEQGIHLLGPGQSAPPPPTSEVSQKIAHALNPGLGLPDVAAPEPRYATGNGYYVDYGEREANQSRSSRAGLAAKLQEALGLAAIDEQAHPGRSALQQAIQQATLDKTKAETAKLKLPPSPQAPVVGSKEWLAAEQARANIDLRKSKALAEFTAGLQASKPPKQPRSEFNQKAEFMYPGVVSAVPKIDSLAAEGVVVPQRANVPFIGNYLIGGKEQQMLQAATVLHDAYLRLTTGATINPSELRAAAMQYVPLPGDKEDVKAQKLQRRHEVEQAIAKAGGIQSVLAMPARTQQTPPMAPSTRQQPLGIGAKKSGDTGNVDLRLPLPVQTIDEMIKAGKSDAEIKAAMARGVH